MTVLCHGVRSSLSSPQEKAVSTTTHFGTKGALSRRSGVALSSASPGR